MQPRAGGLQPAAQPALPLATLVPARAAAAAAARPAGPQHTNPRPLPAKCSISWEARAPLPLPGSMGEGTPVWAALQQFFPGTYPSVNAAKKAVRRREILVDGTPASSPSQALAGGELLQCVQRTVSMAHVHAATGGGGGGGGAGIRPLEVLYEDEHMACVIKPPGTPVDTPPGRSSSSSGIARAGSADSDGSSSAVPPPAAPSVYTRLPRTLAPSPLEGALRRPRHCHRLDEPTGGLLLVGKTRQAQAALCGAFERRQVTKRYRALAWGRLEGRGRLTWELDGRHCDTEYAAVQHTAVGPAFVRLHASAGGSGGGSADAAAAAAAAEAAAPPAVWVTTVDLWPHTGRTHQLRRHMALLGHPLVGDRRYTFGYAATRAAAGLTLSPEGHQPLPAQGGEATAGEAAELPAPAAAVAAAGARDAPQPSSPAAEEEEAAGAALRAVAASATAAFDLKLCLWAVELLLERHPATGEPLHLLLPAGEPASFAAVRAVLEAAEAVEAGSGLPAIQPLP